MLKFSITISLIYLILMICVVLQGILIRIPTFLWGHWPKNGSQLFKYWLDFNFDLSQPRMHLLLIQGPPFCSIRIQIKERESPRQQDHPSEYNLRKLYHEPNLSYHPFVSLLILPYFP